MRSGRPGATGIAVATVAALVLAGAAASAEQTPGAGASSPGAPPARVSIAPGFDRSVPFEITADSIEYRADRELYIAEGRVRIRRGGRRIDADWVAFSPATQRGVASGNVFVRDEDRSLEARFLRFDTESLEGAVYDGELEIDAQGLRVEAEELVRTATDTYVIEDAVLTTCRCPDDDPEPWRLRAQHSKIEVGGYGSSYNSTVEVLRVPVFWLPWLLYPVKTERQSGLLFPSVGIGGRNRVELDLPVFWAAAENVNVTWTPNWSLRRGFKNDVELDTVYGTRSRTSLFGAYIDDQDIVSSNDPLARSVDHFDEDRWLVLLDHDQRLGDRVRVRGAGVFMSDNQYALDFGDVPGLDQQRFSDFVLYGTGHAGDDRAHSLLVGARFADDRQSPDDRDRDRMLLQRWPEASLRSLEAPAPFDALRFLAPALNVDYVRFAQRRNPRRELGPGLASDGRFVDVGIDGLPDALEVDASGRTAATAPGGDPHGDNFAIGGTEGNGRFDVGEPLADEGHRLVLHPRVQWPVQLFGAFEMAPEVGYQQTLYWSENFGFEERGLWTARNEIRTRIRGEFDVPRIGPVDHTLEPRLGWALVSRRSGSTQSKNPLFVPAPDAPQLRLRQLTLDNLTLDPSDRIDSTNRMSFAIANRFARKGAPGRPGGALADVVLSADWDLAGGGFGQLVLDGRSWPMGGVSSRFWLTVDPDAERIDDALVELQAALPLGIETVMSYRFSRQVPRFFEAFETEEARFGNFADEQQRIHQVDLNARVPLGERWTLRYGLRWSFDSDLLIANGGSVEYFSKCRCWGLAVDVSQSRNLDVNFGLRFTLVGPGERGSGGAFDGRRGNPVSPGLFGRQ